MKTWNARNILLMRIGSDKHDMIYRTVEGILIMF